MLHLSIDDIEVEKLKIFPETDIKRMSEDLKTAWHLNDEKKREWQIYFYKESSMNGK